MIIPKPPATEKMRLKALYDYQVLDSSPEARFDDLVMLAAEICEVPVCLISLIDAGRQWFKAKIGTELTETPRDISFCTHAIHQTDIFEIKDATQDERFHDNPIVVNDPMIRYYAGVPLITPDGEAIGTLCVIDVKKRKLTDKQKRALYALSGQVIDQLEMRKQVREVTIKDELLHQALAEMSKARNDALRASVVKSDFLANMSHEIRTPLNGIIGMTELLEESNLPPKQKGYLAIVKYSGEHLLALVNEILDFSKIEAGKMELAQVPFSVKDVVLKQMQLLQVRANEKGLLLSTSIAPELSATYIGDPGRLGQIILNLLSNAIKFTEKGKVSLDARTGASLSDIIFTFKDTGIGVSEEVISRLFKPFSQADRKTSVKYGGTGLGLSICKRLAEAMNGTISIHSQEGVGSTFEVVLKIDHIEIAPVASENDQKQLLEIDLTGVKILLAEDNPTNQLLALAWLRRFGCLADTACDGVEALEMSGKEHYDVILMDCQMPNMDGLEATRAIRKREQTTRIYTPVVALTANAMQGDRERCLESGMDDYLTKPLRKQSLIEALDKIMKKKVAPRAA